MSKPSSSEQPVRQAVPLKEHLDYYIENDFWVFTEYYHRKRGYCCGSGCRHCPYKHGKEWSVRGEEEGIKQGFKL